MKYLSPLVQVTSDVIREFAEDNVKYLELRTTLRDEPMTGMTKRSHLDSVLRAIREKPPEFDIIVKLILSIDRRMTRFAAQAVFRLAAKEAKISNPADRIVVGLDLSGDPTVSDGLRGICYNIIIYHFN